MVLVILGRQGSGKGTQAALLAERYGVVHVSTGDMLRAAVAAGTELGLRAKAVMDVGNLVGDDIMIGIVGERLADDDIQAHGVLLDGFPRTTAQADALAEILGGTGPDLAINLDVPIAEVTERMLARGRDDDTEETISRRLELYEAETAPLLAWFEERGRLTVVDGLGTEDEVFARLSQVVDAR
ncbi:MAG: adenylate kinase [Acidimicrobiia bacterium]|nr:adenylate kinase [bacterium]MXW58149.1 adenylate kinase [Acidimicrobiia bacterium]MYB72783.1 adenylate kinase [Acidimicrobiia bacterium]MYI00504.1 adenylate kinase [Acidimicrobiia bacterium]